MYDMPQLTSRSS